MFLRGLWAISLNGDLIEISQTHPMPVGYYYQYFQGRNASIPESFNTSKTEMIFKQKKNFINRNLPPKI